MGVLLERAKKVFSGGPHELPPAVPFELACTCGERVTGYRQDHRQFVECPGCGETHFVLPLSPYPPPLTAEPRLTRSARIEEEAPPEPSRRRSAGVRLRVSARRARRRVVAGLWRLVPPARWFSRGRLITYAVIAVVAGTAALTVHLNRRGSLAGDMVAARAAWDAVADGSFEWEELDAARRALDRARDGLARFGTAGSDRREIEQLAAEVGVFADLLEPPLEEFVNDAVTAGRLSDADRPAPALVFDAHVTEGSADDPGRGIECRLFAGSKPIRLDATGLELLDAIPAAEPTRVLFGGRIAAIEPAGGGDELTLRLVPGSGVLLTEAVLLEKIGWPLDESTRKVLERQRTWVFERP